MSGQFAGMAGRFHHGPSRSHRLPAMSRNTATRPYGSVRGGSTNSTPADVIRAYAASKSSTRRKNPTRPVTWFPTAAACRSPSARASSRPVAAPGGRTTTHRLGRPPLVVRAGESSTSSKPSAPTKKSIAGSYSLTTMATRSRCTAPRLDQHGRSPGQRGYRAGQPEEVPQTLWQAGDLAHRFAVPRPGVTTIPHAANAGNQQQPAQPVGSYRFDRGILTAGYGQEQPANADDQRDAEDAAHGQQQDREQRHPDPQDGDDLSVRYEPGRGQAEAAGTEVTNHRRGEVSAPGRKHVCVAIALFPVQVHADHPPAKAGANHRVRTLVRHATEMIQQRPGTRQHDGDQSGHPHRHGYRGGQPAHRLRRR